MNQQVGNGSLCFSKAPFIMSTASVVGKKEGEGPLKHCFDVIGVDETFGEENWEAAESALQKEALVLALSKGGIKAEDVRYLFSGDLLGQTIASYFGLKDFEIPMFGLYGACSTCGESLSLASMTVAAGYGDCVAAVTSSHFASAEKQFRFPLEYANQRPKSATWTVTGGGAFILTTEEKLKEWKRTPIAKITGITTGKVIDFGVRDSMNMGAAMAPAACDLIYRHFLDFNTTPEDYDRIVTGDLGTVGKEILIDLLKEKGYDISKVHEDCGIEIFDGEKQGTGAGGSGCGCSAVTLSGHYLKELEEGRIHKMLFVPTGALLSPVSFNEGQTVPGICHGVVIERVESWIM